MSGTLRPRLFPRRTRSLPSWALALAACVLGTTACDEGADPPRGAGDADLPDAGSGDADEPDAATMDEDAGDDAATPLPMYGVLDDLCDLPDLAQRVAVAESGFAHLSCASGSPALRAWSKTGTDPVTIAEVNAETTFEFTLDGGYLLYRVGSSLYVRAVDARSPAVEIPGVEDYRLFMERVSNTKFSPRLITLEAGDGELRSVRVRGVDDGYVAVTSLLEDELIRGDLSLISASGRTALVAVEDADRLQAFYMLRTNAAEDPFVMPFGPGDLTMAPVGLGDTHNFALEGDRVVRVELETGDEVELVPAGAGLLPDISHLLEREDAPGAKHLHYIIDGDPTRRIRDASEPAETLAMANATAQLLTPDAERIIYLSDGDVFSVPAVGGEDPLMLLSGSGLTDELAAVFAPNSESLALLDPDGALWLLPVDSADAALALDSEVRAGSAGFTPDGYLLWLSTDGALKSLAPEATEPVELARGVDAWWPPTTGDEVLYASGKLLLRRKPE